MTTLRELQHKYSWGPIPQWELDKLAKPVAVEAPAPKRGRKPKVVENDDHSISDSNEGA